VLVHDGKIRSHLIREAVRNYLKNEFFVFRKSLLNTRNLNYS
jgi:hypothetical protein